MNTWKIATLLSLAALGFGLASKGKKIADRSSKALAFASPENLPRAYEILREAVALGEELFENWRKVAYECAEFDRIVLEWIERNDKKIEGIHAEQLKIGTVDPRAQKTKDIVEASQVLQRRLIAKCVAHPKGRKGVIRLASYLRQYSSIISSGDAPYGTAIAISLAPKEYPPEQVLYAYDSQQSGTTT